MKTDTIDASRFLDKFLETLGQIDTPTPKTYDFDVVRQLGQSNGRWWDRIGADDPNHSRQKYHIHGTFLCAAHHDWRIPSKCKIDCADCYNHHACNPEHNPLSEEKLKAKFGNMQKPEMYLWFVEAFELLQGKQLDACFEYVRDLWCRTGKIKGIRDLLSDQYNITWETLEEKIKTSF